MARLTQPYVESNAPNALSLVASNYKCYQLYLYRRGCYWHELPLAQEPQVTMAAPGFERVRAFILDPDDLNQAQASGWLPWLQTHTHEKTGELNAQLGCVSGWRVFVR